jgi:hypothetical protein
VESAVGRRRGKAKCTKNGTGGTKGLPSRTSNERHYVRTSKVDPAVSMLAKNPEAPLAELGDEVAPEQARGRARGVMRAEFRLTLVLAPLPLGGRAHEGNAVVLRVAELQRGERDRGTVRVTGDSGSGLVKHTPTLDEHQIGATRVVRQKVTRHCIVLALRSARDRDGIAGGEVRSSSGGERSASIHKQSAATVRALSAERISNEMNSCIMAQRAHARDDSAERRQCRGHSRRDRSRLAASKQIMKPSVEGMAAQEAARGHGLTKKAEAVLTAKNIESRLEGESDVRCWEPL